MARRKTENLVGAPATQLHDELVRARKARVDAAQALAVAEAELRLAESRYAAARYLPGEEAAASMRTRLAEDEAAVARAKARAA